MNLSLMQKEKQENRQNLERYDRITFNRADIPGLLAWRDNNKDLVRRFKPVFAEGVIEIIGYALGTYEQYFKQEGDFIVYRCYMNGLFIMSARIERISYTGKNLRIHDVFWTGRIDYPKDEAVADAITFHASLMAYLEHFRENPEYVESKTIEHVRQKPKKKGKQAKQKRVIKLARVKIYIRDTGPVREKKAYERHTEAWTVRGHSRVLKSGKIIWVNPYVKGEGKREPKTYQVEVEKD